MRKTLFFLTLLVIFSVVLPCRGQGLAESVDSNQTGVVAWALQQYDQHMGYPAVGVLMAVESSFIPFPSELVIPPAVYVSFDETSRSGMTWWLIVVIGTLGALIGAYINYFLSLWLGRPIIYAFVDSRWGHMLGLSHPSAHLHSCWIEQDEPWPLHSLYHPWRRHLEYGTCGYGLAGFQGGKPEYDQTI